MVVKMLSIVSTASLVRKEDVKLKATRN